MPRCLSDVLASRISNSGVSGGKKPAWATTGFSATPATPKGINRQIVGMDHGLDIAPGLVNLTVNIAFAVQARRVG